MKYFIHLIIATSLLGCGTLPKSPHSADQNHATFTSLPSCLNDDLSPGSLARAPANGLMCSTIFTNVSGSKNLGTIQVYKDQVSSDFARRSQLTNIKQQLEADGKLASPIPITKVMEQFREETLPLMRLDPATAEGVVRTMETDLRSRSYRLKEALVKRTSTPFEHVIVGAGVHGVLSAAAILKRNPEARILIIDSADTPGSTFRSTSDVFRINSSSRPSASNIFAVPGKGNLNELPGLPIQVTDLSANKYPTSGDLGRALVAGAYATVTGHPNVRILLSSQVEKIESLAAGPQEYTLTVKLDKNFTNPIKIETSSVVIAAGLGLPGLPKSFVRFLKANPQYMQKPAQPTKLPKVITFEDLLRLVATSDNPKKLFEDLNIDILGSGDSANVFIEFLLGYAPEAAYGNSSGQIRSPKKIRWIGQTARTCEEFIATSRSRYAQIGTGFRSSSREATPILFGVPSKAKDLTKESETQLGLLLENGEKITDSDLIVVATGFEGQLHKVLSQIKPGFNSDKEFMAALTAIEAVPVGSSSQTRVARYIDGKTRDANIVIVGPSAGPLAAQSELVGIIQNTVSIFNNAPRTVSAMSSGYVKASKGVEIKPADLQAELSMTLPPETGAQQYAFRGVDTSRTLTSASPQYLATSLKTFLKDVDLARTDTSGQALPATGEISLTLVYFPGENAVTVSGSSNHRLTSLVQSMAESRDFYGQIADILKPYGPTMGVKVSIPYDNHRINPDQIKITYEETTLSSDSKLNIENVKANGPLELKGLNIDNLNKLSDGLARVSPTGPAETAATATGLQRPNYFLGGGFAPATTFSKNSDGSFMITTRETFRPFKVRKNEIVYLSGSQSGYTIGETVFVDVGSSSRVEFRIVGIRATGTFLVQNKNGYYRDVTPQEMSRKP